MAAGDRSESESERGLELADTPASPPPPSSPATQPSEAFVERPDADKLARAVARARISDALFAKNDKVKLGRYHLLEMVGAGGMGVVWGAWDPELDRRVAIKIVKPTLAVARERILLEGQALAKLSHPNVVPVYDVGIVDDQVYLVMEWVRGQNLRAHGKQPHTVREWLAIYRSAGEGLSAAHRAGLVHRDFKPDNAILGDDGRVRVLDFGLARGEPVRKPDESDEPSSGSDLTRGAGTPKYMPPEQAAGSAITAAVDQYAFCVSLRESLAGRNADGTDADLPRWLDDILARGSSPTAADRFPSMDALLRALARDPATVWRRRALAAAAVTGIGAAFVVGTTRAGTNEVEPCVGGEAEIAAVWNPAARTRVASHFGGLGAFARGEVDRVAGELDRYSHQWSDSHASACLAHERGELTPAMYERALICMTRAKVALGTIVDVLATSSSSEIAEALKVAGSLPDASRCQTDGTVSLVELPPAGQRASAAAVAADVERVRVLALARRADAVTEGAAVLTKARALGYAPLVARAEVASAMAIMRSRDSSLDRIPAIAQFDEARTLALANHDDAVAVEAYARGLFLTSVNQSSLPAGARERAYALSAVVEPIARRIQPTGGFERALLYMNLGSTRLHERDRVTARRWLEQARDLVTSARLEHLELEYVWYLLAQLADDRPAQEAALEATLRRQEARLGPNHPEVLLSAMRLGIYTRNRDVAARLTRSVCARYREQQSTIDSNESACWYELAWLAQERGDLGEMRSALARVPEVDNWKLRAPAVHGFLALADAPDEKLAREIEAVARTKKYEAWDTGWIGDLALVAGLAWKAIGRPDDAARCFGYGVDALIAHDESATSKFARRLARLQLELVRVLRDRDPARSRDVAGAALAYYRGARGYEAIVGELSSDSRR